MIERSFASLGRHPRLPAVRCRTAPIGPSARHFGLSLPEPQLPREAASQAEEKKSKTAASKKGEKKTGRVASKAAAKLGSALRRKKKTEEE